MTAVPAGQSLRCRPRPTAEAIVTPPAGAGPAQQPAVISGLSFAVESSPEGGEIGVPDVDVPGPIEVVEIRPGG